MATFSKSREQEIPELGEMYEFNLGLTPLHREDFIEKLAGYNEEEAQRLAGFSDEDLVDVMQWSDSHDRVTEELDRLDADRISGRVFIFHEGRDEIYKLIFDNDRLGVYDSHRDEWGFLSERVKELELRERVKNMANPVERRKTWKEIKRLNQRANELEEALTEIVPNESQQDLQETLRGNLILDFIASVSRCPEFDAVESQGLAIKGGHPYNALIAQHYLERALQELGNTKYELVPLKKVFGTDAYAVSEWVDQPLHLDIWAEGMTKLYGTTKQTLLPDAYKAGERIGNINDRFSLDDNLDGVIERSRKLLKKLYKGGELNNEDREVIDFYVGIVQAEEEKIFNQREEQYQKWGENDENGFWKSKLEQLPQEREKLRQESSDLKSAKRKVRGCILSDYSKLFALRGYSALFCDLEKMHRDDFEPEKVILSHGYFRVDVRLEHLLFRGFGEGGVPQFSIIDMYHLGSSELEYKERLHGDIRPNLSLFLHP